jgi:ABC-type transporter Mla subunit MlaD
LVGQLLAAGSIDNAGNANSLTSKLDAAAQQIAKGNTKAAINQLNALLNELNAQAGKHITQQADDLLQAGVLYLISNLS